MTFSIVGRSPDGSALGVAVASKFLAVGAYVPAAAVGAGALATQADVNLALKRRGIERMALGSSAAETLRGFFAEDPGRDERQAGAVDARGGAATFTGSRCQAWAGGMTGDGPEGAYAVQGNILTGAEVVDAMVDSWRGSAEDPSLARRLFAALQAGDAAGGDRRGRQSAALLVISPAGGYGGLSDVVVDLRSDDSPTPIAELDRMLDLHELYFGSTPEEELLPLAGELSTELVERLRRTGYDSGDVARDLYEWMGRENFEERWRDGHVDPVVLAQLRRSTS